MFTERDCVIKGKTLVSISSRVRGFHFLQTKQDSCWNRKSSIFNKLADTVSAE
jgi:hypothetical protein